MIEELTKYDQIFTANNFCGQVNEEQVFEFTNKNSLVIFSAPHATRSTVSKKEKLSDSFTGAIASWLKYHSALSTIIRTKYVSKKNTIYDFVETLNLPQNTYFLDIHGMKQEVPFELEIGTGVLPTQLYKKEISIIENLCKKHQISWCLNHPDYHGTQGFTAQYQKRHKLKNILQLEWRRDMRDFYSFPENVTKKTIPFLLELAKKSNSSP